MKESQQAGRRPDAAGHHLVSGVIQSTEKIDSGVNTFTEKGTWLIQQPLIQLAVSMGLSYVCSND